MNGSRRTAIGLLLLGACIIAGPAAFAAPPVSQKDGYAIDGYDPVSYFTTQKPEKGQPAFSSNWRGVTWLFASAGNKAKFDANPEAYAPQYGGHCSMSMKDGKKSHGDPMAWRVQNAKLYLNGSLRVRDNWLMQMEQNIKDSDWHWQKSYANL